VVLLTLFVTFVLTVGLALVVLLTVAAPTLRARGSRHMARIDVWAHRADVASKRALTTGRERVEERMRERLEAHRARSREDRETVHQH
jgi:hypothetical protein